MTNSLAGCSALITGASRGLGLEIARHYVEEGANVFICGRDEDSLCQAQAELAALIGDDSRIGFQKADVSDPSQVEHLVTLALDRFPNLSILVNNAGIYGPVGPIEEVGWDAWARAVEVNLLGSVLTCRALIPQFKRKGRGKIIQLSGGGATTPITGLSAYAASKAAIVRFAETLALELKQFNVDVNAIAPGALNTRMLDQLLDAGPHSVDEAFYAKALEQKASGGTPLENGAELAVWLASSASDGITGKLISAVWDPWKSLPDHREDLASDIYTLRRIVPVDRGLKWGDL